MSRKYVAAVLTCALFLNGCANRENFSEESAVNSTTTTAETTTESIFSVTESSSTASSSTSKQSTSLEESHPVSSTSNESISSVIGSSSSVSSTSASSTVASTASSSLESVPPVVDKDREVVAEHFIRTVSDGETMNIKSGELLEIQGKLRIENGAAVIVEKGGELLVGGTVELDGELTLCSGGKLTMGDDNARIDGAGSVTVQDNFDQINSEHGIIYAHISPPESIVSNGITTVGGVVIANKAIKLPPEYGSWLSDGQVEAVAYNALTEMNSNSPHRYYIVSAYRSYYTQKAVFQKWCNVYGFDEASRISSQAGHSEHQTGLTMDLDSLEVSYANTPEGKWLAENCWKYGFIIRYPDGKENITGYSYEPWHVRYLGKSTASLVYHSGLTLEEFLNVEGGTVVID